MRLCNNCNEELTKRHQLKFCSMNCAAKYNNVKYPKRLPAATKKCKSADCEELVQISKRRQFCGTCIGNNKHLQGFYRGDITIQEAISRLGANRYDIIRANCSNLYKNEKRNPLCQNCGYNKHIEICHIHPISSFPKETKMTVVNSRENILCLCPNCHWEFDNNLLDLKDLVLQVRVELTTQNL